MSDDHHIPTAASQDPSIEPSERLARPFQRFAKLSSSGGIVLLAMTAIAMIWANIDEHSYKETFIDTELRLTVAHNPHHAPGHADEHSDGHGDAHSEMSEGHVDGDADETPAEEIGEDISELAEDAGIIDENETSDHATDHADDHGSDSKKDKHAWHPLPEEPHWWKGLSLQHWINDLLMAIFFLVVGLEIKREILVGELASPKRAALPIFGALGGMVGPALIFVGLNLGKDTIGGWGVPMATDIAFAVGILAMLGSRIPNSLKVFLTSLAIVDDLGALIVIAVFYTEGLKPEYLGYAGTIIALLMFLNLLRCRWITLYLVLGLPLWYCIYMSGVHATIAGVLLALTIPAHARVNSVNFVYSTRKALDVFQEAHDDPNHDIKQSSIRRAAVNAIITSSRQVLPPLHRMEHVIHPWAAFFIIPVFALANAGIPIHGGVAENLFNSASLGIILGLFVGKPLGVILFCMLACKIGVATLPRGVSWRHILGAGALGGIGFTMAIFIANLAFAGADLEHAKLAILVASALSAIFGAGLLLTCKSAPEPEPDELGPEIDPDD
jgi:NhaA family Na+:H+ antiporter